MCPFCYIGKRNFETALAAFGDKEQIEVSWKSFQLDPSLSDTAPESQEDYLIKHKGMTPDQISGMLAHVTRMAGEAGLSYRLDQSIMVNSQKAHRLLQFAKTKGLDNEMEERLFQAYFTEGKNIADIPTLVQLGKDAGLDETEMQKAFTDDQYLLAFQQDIREAQSIGVTGVPFFVFDRKYAVSGAQPPQAFKEALTQSYAEWQKSNSVPLKVSEGESCTIDGNCD